MLPAYLENSDDGSIIWSRYFHLLKKALFFAHLTLAFSVTGSSFASEGGIKNPKENLHACQNALIAPAKSSDEPAFLASWLPMNSRKLPDISPKNTPPTFPKISQLPGLISTQEMEQRNPRLAKKLIDLAVINPGPRSILNLHSAEAKSLDILFAGMVFAISTERFKGSVPHIQSTDFNGYMNWVHQIGDLIIDELVNFAASLSPETKSEGIANPWWMAQQAVEAIEDRIEWIERDLSYLDGFPTLAEAISEYPLDAKGKPSDSSLKSHSSSFRSTIQELRIALRVNNLALINVSALQLLEFKKIPFLDLPLNEDERKMLKKTELDLLSISPSGQIRFFEVKSSARSDTNGRHFQHRKLQDDKRQRTRQFAVLELLQKRLPEGYTIDRYEVHSDGLRIELEDLGDLPIKNTFGLMDREGNRLSPSNE